MALGMTKDSMLDLRSLVEEKNDSTDAGGADTVSLLTTGQSKKASSEYEKIARSGTPNPVEEEDQQPAVETEEVTKARLSLSSGAVGPGRAQAEPSQDADYGEEEKKQDSYGQYAGFAYDYDSYSFDPYQPKFEEPPSLLGGNRPNQGGFLCCIFPWLGGNNDPNRRITQFGEDAPDSDNSLTHKENSVAIADESTEKGPLRKVSSGGEDDDVSTGDVSVNSDKLGEKLSEKDRQAVLARLRLAQPDRSSVAPSTDEPATDGAPQQKGLLKDIPNLTVDVEANGSRSEDPKSSGPRSILKRQATTVKSPEEKQSDANVARRRSLFPSYETNKSKKNNHHVQFAPMARVVTVKSQKDMTPEEKSSIWWQKWDYDDFRKTGRIITRAMLEGGSEIWLASNQSWQVQGQSRKATLQNAMDLSEQAAKAANGKDDSADLIRSTGDKWWHKFGHSRRGLEHIASIKEGSERQANVKHAIRAVVDEQRRQKAYMREDPEKLRMVSIHNTSWARDLAVAAGASDADAVKSNFDEERKSREFYLLKMARTNSISSQGKHVPAFMQPALSTTMPRQLDANTSAQIMFRRKKEREQAKAQAQVQVAPPASNGRVTKRMSVPASVGATIEPIHDPEPEKEKDTRDLAKRAAGFSHDGAEQVNMAAVLSGMGAVPKNATPVGA